MSTITWTKIPFKYRGEKDFYPELTTWISDVFYERLPELGFETREEQIYTSYHMVTALQEKRTLFAEAGSGTGKTFAYLLASLCYARLKGAPVILSSASPMLQDQLTGKTGDIATLSRLLGLDIDARTAKRPDHYICEVKVERMRWTEPQRGSLALLDWADSSKRGERSEVPSVREDLWSQVAWDRSLECSQCKRRGYCRFVKARRDFQAATDFVVCEHEVFLSDLWTREELKLQRKLPYLPDYSAVVFDEGHLVELPMARSLGREINSAKLHHIVEGSLNTQNQREIVYYQGQEAEAENTLFFNALEEAIAHDPYAKRLHIKRTDKVLHAASSLSKAVELFQDELSIEESMNEGTPFGHILASYQTQLDHLQQGLSLLLSGDEASVVWWEPAEQSVWTLPRTFGDSLERELLSKQIPVIFTSATLAPGADFSYMHTITGAQDPLHSMAAAPFDLEQQVEVFLPLDTPPEAKITLVGDLLERSGGRTLVLCGSPGDVPALKEVLSRNRNFSFELFWEGQAERGKLIEEFRDDISSVLIGSDFWEGIDVPGESLSQVIIYSLPFPQADPLLEARRREAREKGLNPLYTIDVPAMLIKLRQGFGRLIRSSNDTGMICILDSLPGTDVHEHVIKAIPAGVKVMHSLPRQ